jgi:Sec-independent protein secretion pathway component TatC
MRIRVVKWLCVAVLFVAFVLWQFIAAYEFPVRAVVCAGAAVVAVQAFHSASRGWTICFLAIALLFNPAIPVLPLANTLGLVAIVGAAAAFAVSLSKLKSLPLLSMPSITDRNPGSESL